MSRFTFRKVDPAPEPELPPEITREVARLRIRICSEEYPASGAVYFEGAVRNFVIERLPRPELVALLPRLLTEPSVPYCLSTERLRIERIDRVEKASETSPT